MPVTDTIADFLTRIRNAGAARHKTVDMPLSAMKLGIAKILKNEGYISDFESIESGVQGVLRVTLRYYQNELSIRTLDRVSKPGRRVYSPAKKLPRVNNGLGICIISTSRGIMTDKEARRLNVGGEVLCTIW